MNNRLLLPHAFKIVGWILFIPSFAIGLDFLLESFFLGLFPPEGTFLSADFTDEFIGVVLLISLIFIGFSKLKFEDEYTFRIRLESFQMTFYIYAAAIALAILTIYNDAFFDFMIINLFAPLLLFVVIFHLHLFFWKRLS